MSQVLSGSESGVRAPRVHCALDLLECATKCRVADGDVWCDDRQSRTKDPGVAAREEERSAQPEVSGFMPMRFREAPDEAMESKATQVMRPASPWWILFPTSVMIVVLFVTTRSSRVPARRRPRDEVLCH